MDNIIYEVKCLDRGDVEVKTQAVVDAGYNIVLIKKKEITPIINTQLYDKEIDKS